MNRKTENTGNIGEKTLRSGRAGIERGRKIKEILLNLLYPPRCPICDEILDRARRQIRLERNQNLPERHILPEKEPAHILPSNRLGYILSEDRSGHVLSGRETDPERRRKLPERTIRALPGISVPLENRCCPSCAETLPWVGEPACMKCGKPVADEGQEYCDDCRKQEHFYDRGVAAFIYTGALRHSVYRMKTSNRRDYIPFFAESMAGVLARYLPRWRPEVIVPVPMHPRKLRRRGYNQSELLAGEISRLTGIPMEKDLLYCTRLVQSQKMLGRKERLINLRGSFAVRGEVSVPRSILLVDDVYTTGSTMDEISRVLRKRGVQSVFFAVLCTGKGKKAVCTAKKV